MGGSADDLKRLPSKGGAPNSPTVSWHRSVTDKEVHRRPPLSNIFPTAAPSPRSMLAHSSLDMPYFMACHNVMQPCLDAAHIAFFAAGIQQSRLGYCGNLGMFCNAVLQHHT